MPDYLTVSNPLEGVDPRVFLESTLPIRPWPDPLIEALGFDPRSAYVEQYWLGILGPSTTWLLRRRFRRHRSRSIRSRIWRPPRASSGS